jgi:hypothetical protein
VASIVCHRTLVCPQRAAYLQPRSRVSITAT